MLTTKSVGKKIEVLGQILSDLRRSKKSSFTQKFLHDHYLTLGFDYSEAEVGDALDFLANPPFNILRKEGDTFSLTLETEEMFKRFGIFLEAARTQARERLITESKRESKPEEKVTGPSISIRGESIPITHSYDILVKTAEWLIARNALNNPIETGYKRYLVNSEPKQKSGDDFRAPKKLSNGWWVETHYSTAACIENAKLLLEKCGFKRDELNVWGFSK